MKLTSQKIVTRIMLAFEKRKPPNGDSIFLSYSDEIDTEKIKGLATYQTWPALPQEVLQNNKEALMYMTPQAFAWFLPAYLIISIMKHGETDTLTTSLITCLTPPDKVDAHQFDVLARQIEEIDPEFLQDDEVNLGADDDLLQLFEERANLFSLDEKAAIRDYLIYIDNTYGAYYPVFGPKQALERYWQKIDTLHP